MSLPWPSVLVVTSVLAFAAYLIWKIRPVLPVRLAVRWRHAVVREPAARALKEEVQRQRVRAREAGSPRDRAEALLAAGRASARMTHGSTAALGLYLRALKADPTYAEPIAAVSDLLHDDRPELLETVLWRRLSQLAWTGDTGPAARTTLKALVRLYRRDIPHRERARALQRLLAHL